MANFTSGKACQTHFGNTLLERIFIAQIPHVVIAPANRTDTQLDILVCEHNHNTSMILYLCGRLFSRRKPLQISVSRGNR